MHDAYNCSISLVNETFLDMQGLTLSLVGFFDLKSVFSEMPFLSPYFQSVCFLCSKVGLPGAAYCRLFFFNFKSSLPLCVF